jgi:hypothetical protein
MYIAFYRIDDIENAISDLIYLPAALLRDNKKELFSLVVLIYPLRPTHTHNTHTRSAHIDPTHIAGKAKKGKAI